MKSIRKQDSVVTDAVTVVEEARVTLARWEAEEAAARGELASLEERAGAEVLDDPEAAGTLTRKMQELRDRAGIARRAIEAQRPRVAAAERAYLLAEANRMRGPVAELEADLSRHEVRTAELLRLLEQHEGRFVPEMELLEERWSRSAPAGEDRGYDLLTSMVLKDRIRVAGLPVLVLEEMAAGREPQEHLALRDLSPAEVYPECVWGPDAVVKAPAYLRFLARGGVPAGTHGAPVSA